jgi:hypothetical protein
MCSCKHHRRQHFCRRSTLIAMSSLTSTSMPMLVLLDSEMKLSGIRRRTREDTCTELAFAPSIKKKVLQKYNCCLSEL